jgi:hypothetical protein
LVIVASTLRVCPSRDRMGIDVVCHASPISRHTS